MKTLKLIVVLTLALFLAGPTVAGAETYPLYVDTLSSEGVSTLYGMTTTGAATEIGNILVGGTTGANVSIYDIAYDPVNGKMYAIGIPSGGTNDIFLYTLTYNPSSGSPVTATEMGNTGVSDLQGLTVSSTGIIYAASFPTTATSGYLYTIDSSTGVATAATSSFKPNGTTIKNYGDLVYDVSNSTLYGSVLRSNNSTIALASIASTGVATVTGNIDNSTVADGLAYLNGTLYAINQNAISPGTVPILYTIGTNGAVITSTNTSGLSGTVYGATSAVVPIPPSAFLLGSGLLGLGLLGWRRKIG